MDQRLTPQSRRYYDFGAATAGCLWSASLGSTKIHTAINGTSKLALEIAFRHSTTNGGDFAPIFSVLDITADTSPFGLAHGAGANLHVYTHDTARRQINGLTNGAWYACQIIYDDTQATANDRLRVFINLAAASVTVQSNPTQNQTLALNSNSLIVSGDYGSGATNSWRGGIWYAALYTGSEVDALLTAINDGTSAFTRYATSQLTQRRGRTWGPE
jgi:hypothetical protein